MSINPQSQEKQSSMQDIRLRKYKLSSLFMDAKSVNLQKSQSFSQVQSKHQNSQYPIHQNHNHTPYTNNEGGQQQQQDKGLQESQQKSIHCQQEHIGEHQPQQDNRRQLQQGEQQQDMEVLNTTGKVRKEKQQIKKYMQWVSDLQNQNGQKVYVPNPKLQQQQRINRAQEQKERTLIEKLQQQRMKQAQKPIQQYQFKKVQGLTRYKDIFDNKKQDKDEEREYNQKENTILDNKQSQLIAKQTKQQLQLYSIINQQNTQQHKDTQQKENKELQEQEEYKQIHRQQQGAQNIKDNKKSQIIKDTIEKLTHNIIVSKQSIIQDIQSIHNFVQESKTNTNSNGTINIKNGIKYQVRDYNNEHNIDMPISVMMRKKKKEKQKKEQEEQVYRRYIEEQQKLVKEEQKKQEREKNKKILIQQKILRKERRQHQERVRQQHINERVSYQHKYKQHKQNHHQVPITQAQIKQYQEDYINRIKERLNIGKHKQNNIISNMNSNSNYSNSIIKKSKSVPKYDNIKSKKDEYRKKFNRKSKFVDKIIMNLKLRADTSENGSKYGSNSTQLTNRKPQVRKYQSAPHTSLPKLTTIPEARTAYQHLKQ